METTERNSTLPSPTASRTPALPWLTAWTARGAENSSMRYGRLSRTGAGGNARSRSTLPTEKAAPRRSTLRRQPAASKPARQSDTAVPLDKKSSKYEKKSSEGSILQSDGSTARAVTSARSHTSSRWGTHALVRWHVARPRRLRLQLGSPAEGDRQVGDSRRCKPHERRYKRLGAHEICEGARD
eukprot:scaffold89910_cov26-Tisochrysis_lutea.AAC.2